MSKLLTLYNIAKVAKKGNLPKGKATMKFETEGQVLFQMEKEIDPAACCEGIHSHEMHRQNCCPGHFHRYGGKETCCNEDNKSKMIDKLKEMGFDASDIETMKAIHKGHKKPPHFSKLSHMMTMLKLLDEMKLTDEGELQALTLRLTDANLPDPIREMMENCCADDEAVRGIFNKMMDIIAQKEFEEFVTIYKDCCESELMDPEHLRGMKEKFEHLKGVIAELKRLGIQPADLDPEYLEIKCLVDKSYKIKKLILITRLTVPNQKSFDFTLDVTT